MHTGSQVAVNRQAVGSMLGSVLQDLPRQAEAAKDRKVAESHNDRYVEVRPQYPATSRARH